MKKKDFTKNQSGITTLGVIIILFIVLLIFGVIAYLFFFKPGTGIFNSEEENVGDGLIEPQITLEVDDSAENAMEVVVSISAYTDDSAGIKGIRLPNGNVIEQAEYEYVITENGEYTFYAIGNNGKEISKNLNVSNIVEASATTPYIPEGFEHLTGEVDEGYVIKDKYGNEFVWIPVPTGILTRNTNFSADYQEPTTELTNSVAKYYGFYVARYEASKSAGSRVAIIKDATPWTNITYTKAVEYISNMPEDYKYDDYTKTSIVNSYAWDTLLAWIDESNESYSSKTEYGNYSGELAKTGETSTDIVNNIADLAGNVREWTSEMYTKAPVATTKPKTNSTDTQNTEEAIFQRVIRGGSAMVSKTPAGHSSYYENQTDDFWGFRVILYRSVTSETTKKNNSSKTTPTPTATIEPETTAEPEEEKSTNTASDSESEGNGIGGLFGSLFNSNSSTNESVNEISEQEKSIFNEKFESYKGENVKGSSVKSLLSTVVANNDASDENRKVKVNNKVEGSDIKSLTDKISNSSEYKVELQYSNDGLVNAILLSGEGV